MTRSKEKMIGMIIIGISTVLAVLGYILLPEVMIVQIGFDGEASNTLPKIPALLIPFAISTISSIFYMKSESTNRTKNLLFAILGIIIAGFSFFMNFGK